MKNVGVQAMKARIFFRLFFCAVLGYLCIVIPVSAEDASQETTLPLSPLPVNSTESTLPSSQLSVNSTSEGSAGTLSSAPANVSEAQNATSAMPVAHSDNKNPHDQIMVNGDQVQYSANNRQVTASGNVVILYKKTRLTCDKATADIDTKDCDAQGHVRLDDNQGTVEGEKLKYNFETKRGTVFDAGFRANPYFGRAEKLEKSGENEFIAFKGAATTCDFDHPHYRLGAKKITMVPGDKIQIQGMTGYAGNTPVMVLPRYNHSLKDSFMHLMVTPGKSRDWGPYLLGGWRYNLSDSVDGRLYLDYRSRLGFAEGFGLNYRTPDFGKGDYKFYYTNERPLKELLPLGAPREYQRYLSRWRHTWEIDKRTTFVSEVYTIGDQRRKIDSQRSFLKDYFFREYEKDTEPLTYGLLHHNFDYSSLDLLVQMRTNHWFSQEEKKPELKYTLPNLRLGDSPFYFEHNSVVGSYEKKPDTAPATLNEETVSRLDTTNKFSMPMRVSFIRLTPYVKNEETFYDKSEDGATGPLRNIFYSGADASTKFYRMYDVHSHFLGMEIERLRHIITPSVGYAFNHEPTVKAFHLRQIDSIDAITRGNAATVGLSNKFQTKRNGQSVDFIDSRVSSVYNFKPKTGDKRGSSFSDILTELTVLPYSWMRFDADATYKHSGPRDASGYNRFTSANYDFSFNVGADRSFSFGQRYQRGGSNQLTQGITWRCTPKWKFIFYDRYEIGRDPLLKRGFKEQEYTVSRDLHCWIVDFSINRSQTEGDSFWVIFRLKAFPEMGFNFNQTYSHPKPGSQNNP